MKERWHHFRKRQRKHEDELRSKEDDLRKHLSARREREDVRRKREDARREEEDSDRQREDNEREEQDLRRANEDARRADEDAKIAAQDAAEERLQEKRREEERLEQEKRREEQRLEQERLRKEEERKAREMRERERQERARAEEDRLKRLKKEEDALKRSKAAAERRRLYDEERAEERMKQAEAQRLRDEEMKHAEEAAEQQRKEDISLAEERVERKLKEWFLANELKRREAEQRLQDQWEQIKAEESSNFWAEIQRFRWNRYNDWIRQALIEAELELAAARQAQIDRDPVEAKTKAIRARAQQTPTLRHVVSEFLVELFGIQAEAEQQMVTQFGTAETVAEIQRQLDDVVNQEYHMALLQQEVERIQQERAEEQAKAAREQERLAAFEKREKERLAALRQDTLNEQKQLAKRSSKSSKMTVTEQAAWIKNEAMASIHPFANQSRQTGTMPNLAKKKFQGWLTRCKRLLDFLEELVISPELREGKAQLEDVLQTVFGKEGVVFPAQTCDRAKTLWEKWGTIEWGAQTGEEL